jgi:endogenous inhibitor of DNA gyrase (YacG/DUF329 family)
MHCPTCEREFDAKASTALPFCCERCRLVDLGRWLDEEHGLPAVPDPEDFEEETPPTNAPT